MSLMGSSTLSLSIKDDVEDLTQMFQRHSTGESAKYERGGVLMEELQISKGKLSTSGFLLLIHIRIMLQIERNARLRLESGF
jgi:hypothetical protein